MDALTKIVSKHQINSLENTSVVCESCEGSHPFSQCGISSSEEVNYVQGVSNQQMRLNSNSYNPQWTNHSGFSWSNTSSQMNPPFNLNTKP